MSWLNSWFFFSKKLWLKINTQSFFQKWELHQSWFQWSHNCYTIALLRTQARCLSHGQAVRQTEHWQLGSHLQTLPIPAWCLKGTDLLGWSTLRLISHHHGYADIAYSDRSCQGREWTRKTVARGYKLLLQQKRTAQKDTESRSDFLFHHSPRLQPKAFGRVLLPRLAHCPFICTDNEVNSCRSSRGKRVLRSMTASSGLHLHFWHTCKVHPDHTFFTADRDHRNCIYSVNNVINFYQGWRSSKTLQQG